MIHFVVKFLICFSKPKSKAKAKSKKTTSKKVEDIGEDVDENLIHCVEQVRNWCHIEYSLLENILPNIELNVVTWGPAAKIYTHDDCRAIKTHTVEDLVWVNFTMVHNISDLEDGDIEVFKDSVISFRFLQDENKIMKNVVNDWPKTFKICKKSDEPNRKCNKLFPELHQIDPFDKDYKQVLKERIDQFRVTRPEKNSIVTLIQIPLCENKIEKKINEISTFFINDTQVESVTKKKRNVVQSKSKAGEKIKTKISETKEKSKLIIRSELLIAGKKDILVEQKEMFPTIKYAAVYITSSKILTDEQDFTFVPFTITINSIEDLPLNHLQPLKIKNIYARYELSNICTNIDTEKHIMNKNVVFDHTNVFFISYIDEKNRFPHLMLRPSVLSLAEVLMTRYFVLKLYGERENDLEIPIIPCLFGHKPDDAFIGTPNHEIFLSYKPPPVQSSEVFLGSACFNLIKLAKGFHTIEASTLLTPAPITTWDPAFKLDEILDTLDNQNDREVILKKFTTSGCIPEQLLIKHSTRVTITVSIGSLLSNLTENQLLEMTNVYNRVIMVFKNKTNAIEVFQHLVEVNLKLENVHRRDTVTSSTSMRQSMTIASILNLSKAEHEHSTGQSFPSSKLSRTRTQSSLAGHIKEIHRNLMSSNKVLTGFFIENKDESLIVVETIPFVTSHVIESVHSLAQNNVHIVHDSSIFFTKRIYGEFPRAKIYTVKLLLSINSLIKNASKYINSNETALQTLLLLDLLRRSQTLNSASVNQLFPSCDQLVTFSEAFEKTAFDLKLDTE